MATKTKSAPDVVLLIGAAEDAGFEFDLDLEPHVLTDKSEIKALPCRVCKRPCVVTRFASANKTACRDHRDRHAPVEVIREIREDMEPDVLTDKEQTKTVPCRTCGRPCVVTLFASAPKVACSKCRKSTPHPKRSTEYKRYNGETQKTTTIQVVSSEELEWQHWVMFQPFDVDRHYIGTEKAEHEAAVQESAEASGMARSHRRTRESQELALRTLPNNPTPKQAEKIAKEAKEYEDRIAILESDEAREAKEAKEKRDRADELARIAFIRGALEIGYQLQEGEDRQRILVKGDRSVPVPSNYLTEHGYHVAEATAEVAA